jgi:hypothetical protein
LWFYDDAAFFQDAALLPSSIIASAMRYFTLPAWIKVFQLGDNLCGNTVFRS